MKRGIVALTVALVLVMSVVACTTVIRTGPPPARVEVVPVAPYPEAVWIGGHWDWRGGNWVWLPGYWERRPYAAAVWVPGHWRETPEGWRWIPGHWRHE